MSSLHRDLLSLLHQRASSDLGEQGYAFHAEGLPESVDRMSFRRLDARSRRLGAALARLADRGDRCLLLFPPGIDYIAAFFGCLQAGVVAVPSYPPSRRNIEERFRSVLRDAGPRLLLSTPEIGQRVAAFTAGWPEMEGVRLLTLEELESRGSESSEPAAVVDPEALAFLQYTSGSTGDPKGVRITHRNLLHNQSLIHRSFGTSEDSVIVGWLPLYHDMGLIGTVLQPLFVGADCHLMSPLSFLRRPMRWLELIAEVGGTVSGGPSFAYGLCAEKATPDSLESLDLSTWRVAFNGSEPVDAVTLDRFAKTFAPCGFRREAAFPCYGLAEATLFVSGSPREVVPRIGSFDRQALAQGKARRIEAGGRRLVSSGRVAEDLRLAIVDPETRRPLAQGHIGEIWVAGASVADGYWDRPDLSREVFAAALAEAAPQERWLRTGDLGFLFRDEVFVSGRAKDLIILRGRNVYPQDVERTVSASHPALVADGAAAFGIEVGGAETLVVVQEIERRRHDEAPEAVEAIRRRLAEREGLRPHEIMLIRQRALPRTSSGKVRRKACRERYLAGDLAAVHTAGHAFADGRRAASAPDPSWTVSGDGDGVLSSLRRIVAPRLGVEPAVFDADRSLLSFGLDSLAAMELVEMIDRHFGSAPSLEALLDGADLRQVAERLADAWASPAWADPDHAIEEARAAPGGEMDGATPRMERPGELSVGQEAIFFLEQLRPETARYNVARAVRVKPAGAAAALVSALSEATTEHPELAVAFALDDAGRPRRWRRGGPRLEVREHLTTDWDDGELRETLEEAAFRPFDLAREPLLRLEILRGRDCDHLLLVAHHLVVDFLSLAGLLADAAARLAPVPAVAESGAAGPSYDAFVGWQRRLLSGSGGEELRRFWRAELSPLPPPLTLPVDRPPPRRRSWRAGAVHRTVEAVTWAAAQALGRGFGATPFVLLFAAFQTLLARISGGEDFLVATPVSTPGPFPGTRPLGYRVNLLPLRSACRLHDSFAELLQRSRLRVSAALGHRQLPFAHIAEALQVERDGEAVGLSRVMLAFYGRPAGAPSAVGELAAGLGGGRLGLGSAVLESIELGERPALFDLQLSGAEGADGTMELSLEFDRELFDRATAESLLERFRWLFDAAIAAPERALVDLPLFAPAELDQVLAAGDGGSVYEPPADVACRDLAGWVRHQAAQTPEALAVLNGETRLTYDELASRVAGLSAALRRSGIEPGDRVAVCLARTPDLIVSLLAVLEAGAVYVPLDPAYPKARLDAVVDDSGARHLVSDLELAERWRGRGLAVLAPDSGATSAGVSARRAAAVAGVRRDPDQLAYVIYTSGSTGRPKAVGIRHGAAVAMLAWAREQFSPAELARTLAATSVTFDLSVFEIFLPLVTGGAIVLVDDVLALRDLPSEAGVTLVNTVPSALDALLASGGLPPTVRTINLAGEALAADLARRIHRLAAGVRLLNLYGPSEDTTYSTFAEIGPRQSGSPPIGLPIRGTHARVVDRFGRPRPFGLTGELWLGGAGLARGYLGQPGKTAEVFVPDPFDTEPGQRLYRTGDLVVQRTGGSLDFLGRLDHQVKIRGFRIELGEIETLLRRIPGVREAAVVGRPGVDGLTRLVAYVVGPQAAGVPVLAEALAEELPRHMVPGAWVPLAELPRTPNGKLDRGALPEPPQDDGPVAGVTDAHEALVASQFEELLGLATVGPDDSFFTCGGHSLLASRLVARLRTVCEVDLAISEVFDQPTPRLLARVIRDRRAGARRRAPTGYPVALDPALLAPGQERMWLQQQADPQSPVYNLAGALEIEGPLDVGRLEAALGGLLRRHEILRARFREAAGRPVMETARGRPVSLPRVGLEGLPPAVADREACRLARREARRGFDLTRPSPFRQLLIHQGLGRHRLVLVLHHLVADGESLRLLLAELEARFAESFSSNAALPFAQVAAWRRALADEQQQEATADGWRREVAGVPPLQLPWDRRQDRSDLAGGLVVDGLPPEVAATLRRLARRQGASLFMVITGLFAVTLARLGAGRDLALGTPLAARDREELAGTIGPLVDVVPLRLRWAAVSTVAELLDGVRRSVLRTLDRQGEPLPADLEPPSAVVALERPWPTVRLGAATARCRPIATGTAKFDLTLTAVDREDGALDLGLEFRRRRLATTTARRWLRLLSRVARQAADLSCDDTPIAAVGALDRIERNQMLVEWNDTGANGDPPLLPAIRRWSGERGEALAVSATNGSLTYRELVERAHRLAHLLSDRGIGREQVVAVLMQRSTDLVVAQLAALTAGAAYLPLDPLLPVERLAEMVRDSGAGLVLTHPAVETVDLGVPAVCLAASGRTIAGKPATPPSAPSDDHQLAYVIYTSGSTGKPKGVATSRRALRHLVAWHDRRYGRVSQRTTQLAGLGFDAAVWEIWPCLAAGGHLHFVDEPERSTPALLAQFLEGRRIQSTFLPTPLLEAMLAEGVAAGPHLEVLLTGGDRLRSAASAAATYRLVNHYGPTECSVVASAGAVGTDRSLPPTLGRPIDDLRLYVTDPEGRSVSLGAAGELLIAGIGLARGYLGRPARTAASFAPDPWSPVPGCRVYRTGDRVRLLADGQIEFLGRLDRQIEVRGHRVEPGEIEVELRRRPEIEDALVLDVAGQLVAYLKTRSAPSAAELRRALRRRLPSYMEPAIFLALADWPLTANGKIDREALPLPDGEVPEAAYVAPRTAVETRLADVWGEILERSRVGVETSFFDLGGHSLQITQILVRVRDTFGVEVAVSDFLAEPTVAGLTRQVAHRLFEQADPATASAALEVVGGRS